jgi:hypothetical protein
MTYTENLNTVDDIINNEDGTITIPAGYYAEDIVFTLQVEEAPEDEIPENEEPIE